jgi:hypothetical protein
MGVSFLYTMMLPSFYLSAQEFWGWVWLATVRANCIVCLFYSLVKTEHQGSAVYLHFPSASIHWATRRGGVASNFSIISVVCLLSNHAQKWYFLSGKLQLSGVNTEIVEKTYTVFGVIWVCNIDIHIVTFTLSLWESVNITIFEAGNRPWLD